ncbi:MAG: hypothetical protein KJ955_02640 [Nanoarchaeota archaeon]|nr:hypothetical protein [Nanoarchaeota archaeon]
MKLRYAVPLMLGLAGCGEENLRKPLDVKILNIETEACGNQPMVILHDRGYMVKCGEFYFIHDEDEKCINLLTDEIPEIRQLWQDFGCDDIIDSWYLFAYSEATGSYIYAADSAPAGPLETSAYFKVLGKIGQKACGEYWDSWR